MVRIGGGPRGLGLGWNGAFRHELESGLRPTLDHHGLKKLDKRSHPEPPFAIERAVDDDLLFRFGVFRHTYDFVVIPLVVSITAWLDHGISFRGSNINGRCMTTQRTHDVVVIGGGSAGYAAARTDREAGADVAIVDQGPLGGLCILRGCMPTKAILRSADVAALLRRAKEFGLSPVSARADLSAIVDRKDRLVRE